MQDYVDEILEQSNLEYLLEVDEDLDADMEGVF